MPGNRATLDEGESAVRRVALEAVASTPNKVRSQLMVAVRVMVQCDFPSRWPEVATQVLSNLNEARESEAVVRDGFGFTRVVSKVRV